jgi:hypothetical protein
MRHLLIGIALIMSLATTHAGASEDSAQLPTLFESLRIQADVLPLTCHPKQADRPSPVMPMTAGNSVVSVDPHVVRFLASFFDLGDFDLATVRAAYAAGYYEQVPAREIGIYAVAFKAPLSAEQRRTFLATPASPYSIRFVQGDRLVVLLWRDRPEDTVCFDAIKGYLHRVIGGGPPVRP